MLVPLTRRALAPVVVLSLLIVLVWWWTTPRAAMPPVSPMGDQPVYASSDGVFLPLVEPVIHAPWLGETSVVARWAGAVLVVTTGTVAAMLGGAGSAATAAALLAAVLMAGFAASLYNGAALAWAVGAVWFLAGLTFARASIGPRQSVRVGPPLAMAAALMVWGAAVWLHPLAVVAWPLVLVWGQHWRGWSGRASGVVATVGVASLAVVAALASAASTVAVGSEMPGAVFSWRDVLAVAIESRGALSASLFAAPEMDARLSPLLAVLAALGVIGLESAAWSRRAVIATAASLVAVAVWWPAWSVEAVRFGTWLLAPLAACGIAWVARQAGTPRRSTLACLAVGSVLVVESWAASTRPLMGGEPRAFRDVLVQALDARSREREVVLVAEDTRLDSALAAWTAGRDGVRRAPLAREAIVRGLAEGRQVLAGPSGRSQMELTGVMFRDAVVIDEPLPLVLSEAVDVLRCAAVRADGWSQLPGIEYSGRLGLELPPRLGGELQLVVGDTLPLALRATAADGRPWPMLATDLLAGPGSAAPPADYWLDGGVPEEGPRFIKRLHIAAHPIRASLLSLQLGRRAPKVLARLSGFDTDARGRVCAAPLTVPVVAADEGATVVPLTSEEAFANGWYGVEGRDAEAFRWAGPNAVLLVRGARRMSVMVTLMATPAVSTPDDEGRGVMLRVNGMAVDGPATVADGRYTWEVPAGVWLEGTNELWWQTARAVRPADEGGGDTRTLALRVSGLVIAPRP
jgi:hypothetical protein